MSKKILVIDDYSPLLEEVSEFLTLENYQVFTAKNGAEGVQKALTTKPDMILCDILMPELNGFEVYETISKIPSLSAIPFIFLTAKATPEDYRKGLDLGVDDYITKPFSLDQLISSIQKRFEKVEKYQSVKQDLIQFFFSNPQLGIFIFSKDVLLFSNEKIFELTGYTQNELNKLNLEKQFIGNRNEILKEINLIQAGVHKSYNFQAGFIKKDKSVVNLEVSVSNIVFNNKNSIIGSVVEKETNTEILQISPSIQKFLTFLEDNNKKEISQELTKIYKQMQIEEDIQGSYTKKRLKLSKREKEILMMICKGNTNKEIAEKLFISPRTVDNHRANILSKTGRKNTAELVVFAIKNNIIEI